jgi:hypothetical protein
VAFRDSVSFLDRNSGVVQSSLIPSKVSVPVCRIFRYSNLESGGGDWPAGIERATEFNFTSTMITSHYIAHS